jgi:hypothetical protein
MPWYYDQMSGRLYRPDCTEVTTGSPRSGFGPGYSGDFRHANYPAAENLPFGGPIPKGFYNIGRPYHHARHRPLTMDLSRSANGGPDRTDLQIHGDNIRQPGNASAGCIIFGPTIREQIAASPDRLLIVR